MEMHPEGGVFPSLGVGCCWSRCSVGKHEVGGKKARQ